MTSKALGLIETIGLIAAIEAADAAAKAATVTVLGYENAKGGGRIAVKLVGDVGAVKAAVSAGAAAALRVGQVASCTVIARPHDELAALVDQVDRGRVAVSPTVEQPAPASDNVAKPQPPAPMARPKAPVSRAADRLPARAASKPKAVVKAQKSAPKPLRPEPVVPLRPQPEPAAPLAPIVPADPGPTPAVAPERPDKTTTTS
jgi:ethanolamine utilization protein EutM